MVVCLDWLKCSPEKKKKQLVVVSSPNFTHGGVASLCQAEGIFLREHVERLEVPKQPKPGGPVQNGGGPRSNGQRGGRMVMVFGEKMPFFAGLNHPCW